MTKLHNTHILIPEDLWNDIRDRAGRDGTTKTEVVCKALRRYLKKGKGRQQ